ncbi:MAG TPA: undecaprenyl-diphosphatase UppP [Bacteriovoracaceae bacterium]|nr:undecaprenyl-diphosphatase UppP [Bacteriovoracaceae bacterium]
MTLFESLLLGLVEGLTEFLPVSSTGHLILASNALGIPNDEFLKLFEIVIQTGAIAAVILIYWKDLLKDKTYFLKLSVAFFPTGVLGLLLHSTVKKYLFTPTVVCTALIVGGIILLFLEQLTQHVKKRQIEYPQYFMLGVFQCLAFIPGVSRSAATILGGRILGASREEAVKFSFLLAIPTILSASGYSLLKVNYVLSQTEILYLALGLLSSFVFGFLSIKVFLKWLNHRTFIICGIYRIIFGLIYFAILL